jgi:chemotaxis regulatin CheY-phosphate phosphatase CheZ
MKNGALTERVASLVDFLRREHEAPASLTEVASVTEVLISVMERYFGALDASLYREFRVLSEYIESAKSEIGKLKPAELKTLKLPRAGKQLDAVVRATEEATQAIMDAAEEIMGADKSDPEAYAATVDLASMRIIEACSFQDITGQRITKVVETLTFIESRLDTIHETWGEMAAGGAEAPDDAAPDDDSALLSGPQLDGEGIDQDTVDALLDEAPPPSAAPETASEAEVEAEAEPEEAPPPAETPEPETASQAEVDAPLGEAPPCAAAEAETASEAEIEVPLDETPPPEAKKATQAEIDALFD